MGLWKGFFCFECCFVSWSSFKVGSVVLYAKGTIDETISVLSALVGWVVFTKFDAYTSIMNAIVFGVSVDLTIMALR